MKGGKLITVILVVTVFSCSDPSEDIDKSLSNVTLAAIGDSITMGVQDAGLKQGFQENAYPYLVAGQMNLLDEFEQPWTNEEGIGLPPFSTPVTYSPESGEVSADFGDLDLSSVTNIFDLFTNLSLSRPYSNLGIGGARLFDIRNASGSDTAEDSPNPLFGLVLRNYGTMLDQVEEMDPELLLLWIGANDILHAVSGGTDSGMTEAVDFEAEYRAIMDVLTGLGTDIIIATIPEYIPFVTNLDEWKQDGSWYLPGKSDISSLNKDTPLYFEEDDAEHLLLYGWLKIHESIEVDGNLGLSESNPLGGDYTLTTAEYSAVESRISDFNSAIEAIVSDYDTDFNVRLADLSAFWCKEPSGEYSDYSGDYVLTARNNTIFSLDSIHPNSLGQAMIANAFIDAINTLDAYSGNPIPRLSVSDFAGQYSP